MTLTPKLIGAVVGAGVAAAIATVSATRQGTSIEEKLERIEQKVNAVQVDVALLKCSGKFPGVCPGAK